MPDMIELMIPQGEGKEPQKMQVPLSVIHAAVGETHIPKDKIETDINRRVQGIIKNGGYRKLEELLADDTVVAQVAEKHGLSKTQANKGAADEAVAEQIRLAVAKALGDNETKVLKPLQDKSAKDSETITGLRKRDLERQILQSAANRVKPEMLKGMGKGKIAPFVALLMEEFEFEQESGEWYQSDGKGNFPYSSVKDQTHVGVDEFISKWIENADNAGWVVAQGQGGAGTGAGKGAAGRVAGEVWLTQSEASDGATFQAALKQVGGDHSKVKIRGLQYGQ